METAAEDHMAEDVESTSLPAHVALCNERWERAHQRLGEIEGILEEIRKDFKNLTRAALALLITITGVLIYRFIILQHIP